MMVVHEDPPEGITGESDKEGKKTTDGGQDNETM